MSPLMQESMPAPDTELPGKPGNTFRPGDWRSDVPSDAPTTECLPEAAPARCCRNDWEEPCTRWRLREETKRLPQQSQLSVCKGMSFNSVRKPPSLRLVFFRRRCFEFPPGRLSADCRIRTAVYRSRSISLGMSKSSRGMYFVNFLIGSAFLLQREHPVLSATIQTRISNKSNTLQKRHKHCHPHHPKHCHQLCPIW